MNTTDFKTVGVTVRKGSPLASYLFSGKDKPATLARKAIEGFLAGETTTEVPEVPKGDSEELTDLRSKFQKLKEVLNELTDIDSIKKLMEVL